MKTSFTLVLFFLAFISAVAQPFGYAHPDFRIALIEYENASGEKGTTQFTYNDAGQMIFSYWTKTDSSRYSFNHYNYDEKGQLISTFRDFSDGLTSHEIFLYDEAGNKIFEQFQRSDSVSGSASYFYSGKLLKQATFEKHKGWLDGTLTFEGHGKNPPLKAVLSKDGNSIATVDYAYDSNGNMVKESWDFNGKWRQSFAYTYEKIEVIKRYYSSPFLVCTKEYFISKEDYTFNNEINGPSHYFYNEEGLLSRKRFIRSDSVFTDTEYSYDDQERLAASKRIYSNGDVGKFTYRYDGQNRLVERLFHRNDSLNAYESYLYDAHGNLFKAYLKNFDNWLTGTINFETDLFGQIVSGRFNGENGFDADIFFKYNELGLPESIRWEFSFGKFQEYRLEYQKWTDPK